MKHPYENPDTGGDVMPVEAAGGAEEAHTEQPAEADIEAGDFGPETLEQAEAAIRKELKGEGVAAEDRKRGEFVADETREIGGVLSKLSGKAGKTMARVLAGGMMALSFAALPNVAKAERLQVGLGFGGPASDGSFAGLRVVTGGGSKIARERYRAVQRLQIEQIRSQERIAREEIRARERAQRDEIRRSAKQPRAATSQRQETPPPPPPEEEPPTPVIGEQ